MRKFSEAREVFFYPIKMIFFLLFFLSAVSFPVKPDGISVVHAASPVTINVDVSKELGHVPYLYRTGMFLNSLPVGYPKDKFLKDHNPGMIEFSTDFYSHLRDANSYDEFFSRLPSSNLTHWVKGVHEKGGEPLIRLMPIPKWLWRDFREARYRQPPKDYDQWANFVEGIVNYFNNQLKIDVQYVVWDEPNEFFHGSEKEYFKLYKYSVLGAKRANRNAKIGGPGVVDWSISKDRNPGRKPILYNLIKYCSREKLSSLGYSKLPIDIVLWHAFNKDPYNRDSYEKPVQEIKKWLKEFGYPENTPQVVGSWNSNLEPGHHQTSPDRDNEFLSSFVIASIAAMEKAGIDRHMFFNLFEDWERGGDREKEAYIRKTYGGSGFFGGWGIVTKDYIIKPAYNAFRLLSMLSGRKLKPESKDPFITAVAGMRGNKVMILLSNFVPRGNMYEGWLANQRRNIWPRVNDVYSTEELKLILHEAGITSKELKRRTKEGGLDELPIPEDLKKILKTYRGYEKEGLRRQRKSLNARVSFKNLSGTKKVAYQRYVINSQHGNSHTHRHRIETAFRQIKKDVLMMIDKQFADRKLNITAEKFSMMKGEEKRHWMNRLAPLKRGYIENELPRVIRQFIADRIAAINEWPSVRLQAVDDRSLTADGQNLDIEVEVEPYSVNLMILTRMN